MPAITLSDKAATAVKRIMEDTLKAEADKPVNGDGHKKLDKLYLRLRVVGGGCSGFQNKLDLDPEMNEKLDEVFDCAGVPIVVDKRSLMYLDGVSIDFHDDLNRTGFSVSNPQAKSTCGCGSSYSM